MQKCDLGVLEIL